MRKILMPVLAVSLLAACETKTPAGPTALPTTTTTTTIIVPPTPTTTTSSSTTTTIVLGSLARRYVAFNPPANQPSEMTLFFELLTPAGGASSVSMLTGMLFGGPQTAQETENRYRVTGVYIMPNGTTGGITGTLGGALNPLETGGTFTGMFTAKTPLGCTAERPFAGRVNPQTLQLGGTEPGTSTCSPSPLAIPTIEMLRSDPAAPVPTPPSTTSVSTTTTTSIVCSYSVSPLTHSVESGGGPQSVTVTTQAACSWSAQSFADWIVVRPPFGGAGTSTVTFDVQSNATGAPRSGTLLIAGAQVVVNQNPPRPDLVPDTPTAASCVLVPPTTPPTTISQPPPPVYNATLVVRNVGPGLAGASQTRIEFDVELDNGGTTREVVTRDAGPIASGGSVTHTVTLPDGCWQFVSETSTSFTERCDITVIADSLAQVPELSEANNTAMGSCTRTFTFSEGIVLGAGRSAGR